MGEQREDAVSIMVAFPLNPDQFRWHYNGMISDLRSAMAGKANFLCALGLLVYAEVLRRDVLERRGLKKPGREESFYCFWEEFMKLPRGTGDKIYEHFRHGLAHTYKFLAADMSIVAMHSDPNAISPDPLPAISMSPDGKIKTITVNAYWRDFQRGIISFAREYPDILAPRPAQNG